MARPGRLPIGEREKRLDVLVSALLAGELTPWKVMDLFGVSRFSAGRWMNAARAELRRLRTPITPDALALAGSAARANLVSGGLKNGVRHVDAA